MDSAEQATFQLPDLPGIGKGWELALPADERARRCTGDRAAANEEMRRGIIRACVHLGTRRVAEAFDVSREVVRIVRAEAIRSGELDRVKEEAGRRAFVLADRFLDRLEDEVDHLPIQQVPVAIGILTDKALLLSGQATQLIRVERVDSVASLADYIAALPAAEPVGEGENGGQKGELALPAGAGIPRGIDVAGDPQSRESAPAPEGEPQPGTESGTAGAPPEVPA